MGYENIPTGLGDSPCLDIVNETYRQNCLDMGYDAYLKQSLEALKPISGPKIDRETGLPVGLVPNDQIYQEAKAMYGKKSWLEATNDANENLTAKEQTTAEILSLSTGAAGGIGTGYFVKKQTKSTGWAVFLGFVGAGIVSGITKLFYVRTKVNNVKIINQ